MSEEMKLLRALCEAPGFEVAKCQISTEKRAVVMAPGDLDFVDSPVYGYKLVPKKKHAGVGKYEEVQGVIRGNNEDN